MKALRLLFALLFSFLLAVVVFLGIPLGSISSYIYKSDNVKSWLVESEIYENAGEVVPSFLPSVVGFTEGSKESESLIEELEDEDSDISVSISSFVRFRASSG